MGVFDIVFANLIAQVILDMAAPLASATARGGSLILSGILTCHKEEVKAAFINLGMTLTDTRRDDSWVTMRFAG
ncbi:MAG: hypothetical protein GXP54_04770 [Deltaproteobacteria bacterium]|nr:hypothetical protein [Deltaproteobacteria bacterium]